MAAKARGHLNFMHSSVRAEREKQGGAVMSSGALQEARRTAMRAWRDLVSEQQDVYTQAARHEVRSQGAPSFVEPRFRSVRVDETT